MDEFEKLLQELKAAIDKAGTGSQSRRDIVKKDLDNLKKSNSLTTKELQQRNKALQAARELVKGNEKLIEQIDDRIKAGEKVIKANLELKETINKVGESVFGLGKAALRGSGSISDFTDNIFGLQTVGRALDTNIETFRGLSQVGANFGKSIVDLRNSAAEAALPIDDFAELVKNNSQALAALFGSTTIGAKEIATLGRRIREDGIEQLAPLGFTVDEINETLLLNLENQRRTGNLESMTTNMRIKSSIAFAEQLDRLAKLTGAQRDELRKNIENQQSNERFQAFLAKQTGETGNRLRAFASTIETIAPDVATGFQDLIANAGEPVTDAALELFQNIPEIKPVIKDLIAGVISEEEALVRTRDISRESVKRLAEIAATGQVDFTRLFSSIQNLSTLVLDTGKVAKEQEKPVGELVKSLTTFEQATKVLAAQFQGIETSLLKAFGPALGNIVEGVQDLFKDGGRLSTVLKENPGMTAGLLAGALTGKFLFDKAGQIAIIAAGVRIGGGIGGAGAAGRFAGRAGLATLGLAGTATGVGMAASGVEGGGLLAMGGGALTGAQIGAFFGPAGIFTGAILGGLAGLIGAGVASKAAPPGKQFGGGIDAGKTYLVGEAGPEIITSKTTGTVTANTDLRETFDTEALESKMSNMIAELTAANKNLASMVTGVNTLVGVESRALKAGETIARKVGGGGVGLV